MIHEDAARPLAADGRPAGDDPETFDDALRVVADLTMALSSAISDVAFADAARRRIELENALRRAGDLIVRLSDGTDRAVAFLRLIEMRSVAVRLFKIAPVPSAAAITAAESGDQKAWLREEESWIAGRLAAGTNPYIALPRRDRRDTLPDSPRALGVTARTAGDRAVVSLHVELVSAASVDDQNTPRHADAASSGTGRHEAERSTSTAAAPTSEGAVNATAARTDETQDMALDD